MLAPPRLVEMPQHVLQIGKEAFAQLTAKASAGAHMLRGGAGELVETVKYQGLKSPAIPLWFLIHLASKAVYPSDHDPDAKPPAIGGEKPSRTEEISFASFPQLLALGRWVHAVQTTIAGALYALFSSIHIAQVSSGRSFSRRGRATSSRARVCSAHASHAQWDLHLRAAVR